MPSETSVVSSGFRWLQRKRYQYEVTFSLYMLTPTEKFIFNSCIFIIFSMVLIAGCLYLPQHITFLMNRAWFYYQGDADSKDAFSSSVAVATTLGDRLRAVVETARASAATAAQKEL
ncbi:hypothetical protein VC83_07849 [Pseudogymnoascus destructans]|uniref:Uncharacterized protein n=2 Tax=Pseudogymnoascus destructans TaxID=655981 RepID=L8FP27_PSED2|nr:uncharacterized protein VC83_07849 [Pseudogymnoascus destructans]ELR02213.1 hypothetical protein GMDG_01006 [Pseudogymnoascus destructans 20631-21]OAF55742.1 hypothetical protein VC83_07849 [Pseudogymnoascus destructans]